MTAAYYNENDPKAAAWLRELIRQNLIAPGVVDERSIEDIRPGDLDGFVQCHFFAGIGVWSYALRQAGWPDDRSVWTGSCPCQPFSAAGKGDGFDDERHLWPAWFQLIAQCRPQCVYGEQVASKDGLAWLDLVHADLEAADYSVRAVDLCAAGVGAPHIRQRLWFVADAGCERHDELNVRLRPEASRRVTGDFPETAWSGGVGGDGWRLSGDGDAHIAADSSSTRLERRPRTAGSGNECAVGAGGLAGIVGHADFRGLRGHAGASDGAQGTSGNQSAANDADAPSATRILADDDDRRCEGPGLPAQRRVGRDQPVLERYGETGGQRAAASGGGSGTAVTTPPRPGPTNGHWATVDWIACRDGKWRPVEPGTFPLAHGAAERVGRLRGYGNAIVAPAAVEFVRATL